MSIKELLDSLEGRIAELYSLKNSAADNGQECFACKDLALQGIQIMQLLIPMLGEPVI